MDANFTADPRFQAWSRAAHRSFGNSLDAALKCANLDEMEQRAILIGAAFALAEKVLQHESGASSLIERVERAQIVWATLGTSAFMQLAAGLTPPPGS